MSINNPINVDLTSVTSAPYLKTSSTTSDFELIFELDRRLQTAQNHSSPLINLQDAYAFLDSVLLTSIDQVDTIFLKLIDFFIKCNCNYKRSFISESIKSATWLSHVKNRTEAIKRLANLWDQSVICDQETALQILILFISLNEIFFNQSVQPYEIFFEAISAFGTVSGDIFEDSVVKAASLYIQRLFNELMNNLDLDEDLISFSNVVGTMLSSSIDLNEIETTKLNEDNRKEIYKIFILGSLLAGEPIDNNLPNDIKEEYSNLLF